MRPRCHAVITLSGLLTPRHVTPRHAPFVDAPGACGGAAALAVQHHQRSTAAGAHNPVCVCVCVCCVFFWGGGEGEGVNSVWRYGTRGGPGIRVWAQVRSPTARSSRTRFAHSLCEGGDVGSVRARVLVLVDRQDVNPHRHALRRRGQVPQHLLQQPRVAVLPCRQK